MLSLKNALLVSVLVSLAIWFADSALDAWVFAKGSFADMLILAIPAHEIYVRAIATVAVFIACLALRHQLHKRHASQERILHLNRVLRAIRNVNQLIARESDRDVLLQKACDCLTETRGYWTAWIVAFDDNRRFISMAASNLLEKGSKLRGHLEANHLPYCCQQALLSTGVVSYNLRDDCGECPIRPLEHQVGMAMQIAYGKTVYGVLVVTAPAGMIGDPQEHELMEEIAGDLGFALHDIEIQKQALEAARQLEQSNEWLATTLSSIGDGVIAVDAKAQVSFTNPVASALTGWGSEAIGRPLAEVFRIINAHTRQAAPSPVDRVLAEGNIVGLANHTVLISRDGREYQIADSAAPIRSGGGPVRGVVLVFRDVTEQYRKDQALAASEQRYHSLFDSLQEGFALHEIICDDAGKPCDYRFLEVNPAFERLTSLRAADILGKTVLQVLPSVEQSWIDTYGRVALTGEPARFQNFAKGLDRHYDVIAFSPRKGQFATLFVDVTEIRHVEAERETMIRLLRLLNAPARMQELPQQTLSLLREWSTCEAVGIRLREDNDYPYYETSGFSEEFVAAETKLCADHEGHGDPCLDCMCGTVLTGRTDPSKPFFTAAGSFWTNSTSELLAGTTEQDRKGRTRNRCHGEGYESVALVPLRVGEVTLGLLQFNDKRKNVFTPARIAQLERLAVNLAMALAQRQAISERKHLEEQLRQSQKLEAIGRLAGGVAHDFRNQLTVIKGYCDLLMPSLPRDNPLYEPMDQIRKAAERSAAITNQLLIFSRKQPLHAERLDLNSLLQESQSLLATMVGEDIRLVIHTDDGQATVLADKSALQQALMNLVANARDAMPSGGQLRIETSRVDRTAPSEAADGRTTRPCVMLSVSDTGIGMDAETLSHVFDPFFTTKDVGKGTGLGLATVYGFMQQSGGEIDVESLPGQGATFRLNFPLCAQAAPAAAPGAAQTGARESAAVPAGTETVMVVEDEPAVQKLIVQLLGQWGYKVLNPASPAEAIEIARRREGSIDLLLSDIIMPETNGIELAEQICKLCPRMKVLFISGHADRLAAGQIDLRHQENLLVKPFSPDSLARSVRRALDA